ncbi:MAG: hypothetical protein ACJAVE_001180 [Polaribacter sp.]|jgi:hypothetical protein
MRTDIITVNLNEIFLFILILNNYLKRKFVVNLDK